MKIFRLAVNVPVEDFFLPVEADVLVDCFLAEVIGPVGVNRTVEWFGVRSVSRSRPMFRLR